MASAHWRTGHTVNSLLHQRESGWNFLQLVRLLLILDQAANEGSENAILEHLAQRVKFQGSLAADFPPGEIRSVKYWGDRARTEITTVEGALGTPDGPLPEPFVTWLRELEDKGEYAMSDFLNMFNNRLLALRYLVNRTTRPTLMDLDALDSDSGRLLLALTGKLSEPNLKTDDLALSGLFANCRTSLPVVRQLFSFSLGLPLIEMSSYLGGWVEVDEQDHTHLGHRHGTTLGRTATLGKKYWDQHKSIGFVLGPVTWPQLCRLVPNGDQYPALIATLKRITDGHSDCQITFICKRNEIPPPSLSSTKNGLALGLTTVFPTNEDKGDDSPMLEVGDNNVAIKFWVMASQWQERRVFAA